MPIPDFDADGLLPPGRHRATAEEVRDALVDPFTDSTTRASILTFWEDRRTAVAELVDVVAEWLDGSFTSAKRDPADMDLVTVVDGPSFDALPRHRRQVLASLVAGTTTEAFWQCDANVVVHYPPDDLAHARSVVAAGCWAAYFGHTRDGAACGLVEVVGEGHDPVDVDVDEDPASDAQSLLAAHVHRFDRALQAFDDPEATERPGLRLMATTLRDKRDELRGKLAAGQRVELAVRPSGEGPGGARGVAAVLGALVEAVDRAVDVLVQEVGGPIAEAALAAATALDLVGGPDEDDGSLVLRAAPPDVRGSVPAPDGHGSLVEAALQGVLDALEDHPADGPTGDVAAAVARHGQPVELVLRWPDGSRRVGVPPAPPDR